MAIKQTFQSCFSSRKSSKGAKKRWFHPLKELSKNQKWEILIVKQRKSKKILHIKTKEKISRMPLKSGLSWDLSFNNCKRWDYTWFYYFFKPLIVSISNVLFFIHNSLKMYLSWETKIQ